jgi:hypothetical protein
MDEENKKSVDIFGIAPYGEAIKKSVEKGFDGAQAVLGRICLPAAEELGLLFQDKVRHWRLNNIIKIIQKTEGKIDYQDEKLTLSAHPRVVKEIIDNGSWCDNDEIQNMWAGLIASTCNEKEGDDGNLLYVDTLKRLTVVQAKILNYICVHCVLSVDKNGFVFAEHIKLNLDELKEITSFDEIHRLDTEFDNLASFDILKGGPLQGHGAGFAYQDNEEELKADLEPSPFALALYVKAQGYKGSPKDYFKLEYKAPAENKN